MARELVPHSSHWGAFEAEVADGTVVAIHPYRHDPDPSPLLGNIVDSLRHPARIAQPMIRAGCRGRSAGHTAELQPPVHLVCRLLRETTRRHARKTSTRTHQTPM